MAVVGAPFAEGRAADDELSVGAHVVVVESVVFYLGGQGDIFLDVAVVGMDIEVVYPRLLLYFYPHEESGIVEYACQDAGLVIAGIEGEVAGIGGGVPVAVGGTGGEEDK